jgi:hypothetical protein
VKSVAIALACVALGACAVTGPVAPVGSAAPASIAAAPRGASAAELVAYLGRLRGMSERALAAEVVRARLAARGDAGAMEAVKLAIVLSHSVASEEAEILALLEPIAKREGADEDIKAMASFLLVQATERRRLKEGATASAAKLRDERRVLEAQKQRVEALQERAAQLQQKLDALTELEKSLSDRQAQGR